MAPSKMNSFKLAFALIIAVASPTTVSSSSLSANDNTLYVNCMSGSDVLGSGTEQSPYQSPTRAQQALRTLRRQSRSAELPKAVISIQGLCELAEPLVLDSALDSNTVYRGESGALLSGGTKLTVPTMVSDIDGDGDSDDVVTVDLTKFGFTLSTLGKLKGRGYSGGSACIDVNNFETSAAELFYRPDGPQSAAGARAYGADELGKMQLARFPNAKSTPAKSDWAKITKVVDGSSITISDVTANQLTNWNNEIADGTDVWMHGLWSWNWADSHRNITSINTTSSLITVGVDDINRDVTIITGGGAQGGNVYAYNLKSELDVAGEYFVDKQTAQLSFIPPASTTPNVMCHWNVTISRSDEGSTKPWESLDVVGSKNDVFHFAGCSATYGPMGEKCTKFNPPIPRGANTLVNSNGTIVGEGVCCNNLRDSVISAVIISCDSPPPSPPGPKGSYHMSRLDSVVQISGVSNVSFQNLEIRYSRGAGVAIVNSTDIDIDTCTVSNHGMMGVNVTAGARCTVRNSEVAANGDSGVVLYGGNRTTLTPSNHSVSNCTVHHNQRWIMNYAPDVFLGGVGQTIEESELYGSPQISVFMQGNDHTLMSSDIHDVGRQCSDCGAFYMGRDWTYRGNQILQTKFSLLSSIWGGPPSAVYLDDQLSSVKIAECVFEHVDGFLIELGGGRHNEFVGNTVIGVGNLHMDDRGGGGSKCVHPGGMPYMFLARVPYNMSGPWLKYPGLATILSDEPCTPKHNVISNNVLCGGLTSFSGVTPAQVAAWGSNMMNNTVGHC